MFLGLDGGMFLAKIIYHATFACFLNIFLKAERKIGLPEIKNLLELTCLFYFSLCNLECVINKLSNLDRE